MDIQKPKKSAFNEGYNSVKTRKCKRCKTPKLLKYK